MSKNNVAGIVGVIATTPKIVLDAPTMAQKIYEVQLERKRPNGKVDKMIVQFPGKAAGNKKTLHDLKKGAEVLITGEVRTKNVDDPTPQENKVKVYIYADAIVVNDPPAEQQNNVRLQGRICKMLGSRTTRRGIAVTSIVVAVNSPHGANYIPCICWGEAALAAAELPVGTQVEVIGRMQSREYAKKMPNGKPPYLAVAYEVTVTQLAIEE